MTVRETTVELSGKTSYLQHALEMLARHRSTHIIYIKSNFGRFKIVAECSYKDRDRMLKETAEFIAEVNK